VVNHLLDEIREFHADLNLGGMRKTALVHLPDRFLSYLISLLRGEEPEPLGETEEEWSRFLAFLGYHGVVPLLYRKIGDLPEALRPTERVLARMRQSYQIGYAACVRVERQVRTMMSLFHREQIEALVVKGPALAWSVYPDPAIRPSSDLDFLVRPDQYPKAREALKQLGYHLSFPRFEMFQTLSHAEQFVHPGDPRWHMPVDLHWHLLHYYGIDRADGVEAFFQNRVVVETPSVAFPTLSRVHALIHSAFHLILNHPDARRLIWMMDIGGLAKGLAVPKDWEILQDEVSRFKGGAVVENALKLACMWTGLRLPEGFGDFRKWIQPTPREWAEIAYVTRKGAPDIRLKGYLKTILSAPKKLPYLMRLLFPHPDYLRMAYPPSKQCPLAVSYIRRWGSWMARVVRYMLSGPNRRSWKGH